MKTTINIERETRAKLKKEAAQRGITATELTTQLIFHMFANRKSKRNFKFKLLTYQQSRKKDQYVRLHIDLSELSYERLIDIKKIYKFSISKLLAVASNKYLNHIIMLTNTSITNCYVFEEITNVQQKLFALHWGIPQQITLSQYTQSNQNQHGDSL